MTDKKIYEQTKPRYSRDINIVTDKANLDHTQHSATEDSYERFQNLIAEFQNLDGINPDNTPIGISGGIALTWGTDEQGGSLCRGAAPILSHAHRRKKAPLRRGFLHGP